jgi:hypothetical protein
MLLVALPYVLLYLRQPHHVLQPLDVQADRSAHTALVLEAIQVGLHMLRLQHIPQQLPVTGGLVEAGCY